MEFSQIANRNKFFYSEPHTHRSIVNRNVPSSMMPTTSAEVVDWFRVSDVVKIADSPILEQAEDMLVKAAALCEEKVPKHFDCIKFQSRVEGRVARFLAEKKNKSFPSFEDLAEIMEELKSELSAYLKTGSTAARSAAQRRGDEDLNMSGTRLCVI